jgi:undecaprenyl-diphosphatase
MIVGSIPAWDIAFFKIINSSHTAFFDRFFSSVSNLGNGWVMFPIFFLLLLWKKNGTYRKTCLILAAVTLSVGGVTNAVVKELVDRPRPSAYFVAPGTREALDPDRSFEVHVVGGNLTDGSFPSGHTNTAFSLATLAVFIFGRQFWPVYAAAAIVAFSRVYLGFHFPLDTLAGACLGVSITLLVWLVASRLRLLKPGASE